MMSPLSMIQNASLKEEALTHRSFTQELKIASADNERLEFLGDALLDCWIAESLMKQFPLDNEGTLSKKRASLVNEEVLSQKAKMLELDKKIKLGPAEAKTGGAEKVSLLSDTFEAVLAALYLDQGFEIARSWLQNLFAEDVKALENKEFEKDYKSRFQEWAQSELKLTPLYILKEEVGPPHLRQFHVDVKVDQQIWGSGVGSSKKKAEQKAAEAALVNPKMKEVKKKLAKLKEDQGTSSQMSNKRPHPKRMPKKSVLKTITRKAPLAAKEGTV
jgi:ribonuclease III